MEIVSKDIENGKKNKIMHMNTLHDKFLDFYFGKGVLIFAFGVLHKIPMGGFVFSDAEGY